jgi:hypothetical protein
VGPAVGYRRPGGAADIQRLANLVANRDDAALQREAEAVAKKYKERRPLMHLFTKRAEKGGGLGVGKQIGAIVPDGIEAKIQSLAKKSPSTAELEELGDDLVRMTQVTAAVAEVIKHKCEVDKKVGYLDPLDWKHWCEEMHQSSLDLAEAVQARDGAKVMAAAAKLHSICNNCHRVFRE